MKFSPLNISLFLEYLIKIVNVAKYVNLIEFKLEVTHNKPLAL